MTNRHKEAARNRLGERRRLNFIHMELLKGHPVKKAQQAMKNGVGRAKGADLGVSDRKGI